MAEARRGESGDIEAEYVLLGMGLSNPKLWPSILARVSPDDCSSQYVRRLLDYARNSAKDGLLVGLSEMSAQVDEGERQHLAQLRIEAPPESRLEYWAGRVAMQGSRFKLERLSWKLRGLLKEGKQRPAEIASEIGRGLTEVVDPGVASRMLAPAEWLERWQRDLKRRREATDSGGLGLPTGLATLDRDVVVEPGHLVLVAAETGVGKTAFGLSVARHSAGIGAVVVYANTEMDVESVAARVIAADAGVDIANLRRGRLSADEQGRVDAAAQRLLKQGRLHLSEPLAGTDPEAIGHLARAYHAEHGCDVLVVDYVGRLDLAPSNPGEREWQVLERTAARMKALAVELRCAVYLLVQRTEDGTIAGSRRMRNDADLVLEITRMPEPEDEDDSRARRGRKSPATKFPSATHVIAITKARHAAGHYGLAVEFDAQRMTWREVGAL